MSQMERIYKLDRLFRRKRPPSKHEILDMFEISPAPDLQSWRVKNISTRYAAAGVRRFAFLFPASAPVPPMMNRSSPGESFETRAFNSVDEATKWLIGSD